MKSAKLLLIGLSVLGIVSGILAFKVNGLTVYYIQKDAMGDCTVTLQFKEVAMLFGHSVAAATESGPCTTTIWITDQQ